MKLNLKLKGRLYLIFIPMILVTILVFGSCVYGIFLSTTKNNIESDLESNANFYKYLITKECPGEYMKNDDSLFRGDKDLAHTNALQVLKAYTQYDYSLFCDDVRIMTTIQSEEDLIGKKASSDVAGKVLNEREKYMGEAEIGGKPYYTYYEPIISGSGEVIGMFFIGKDITPEKEEILRITTLLVSIGAVLVVIALICIAMTSRRISKRFLAVVNYVHILGDKDFSKEVSERKMQCSDESGDIFRSVNKMRSDIKETMMGIHGLGKHVNKEADTLSIASNEMARVTENVAETISKVSQGTIDQATDLSEINNTAQALGHSVESMQNSVACIDQTSEHISRIATASNEDMQDVLQVLSQFNTSFNEYSDKMREFAGHMENIVEIVDTIEGISKQTNLLALNAAIEAARAGEMGKGFSVVAEEIRSLAEQSQEATKNISEIISGVSEQTRELITNTNDMDEQLGIQTTSLNKMTTSFDEIFKAVEEIMPQIKLVIDETGMVGNQKDEIIGQISNASAIAQEISASCEEVSAATEEINTSTTEVANTAEKLKDMTEELRGRIGEFKLK